MNLFIVILWAVVVMVSFINLLVELDKYKRSSYGTLFSVLLFVASVIVFVLLLFMYLSR
jgi:lipopolysaccharide export LptBFGC system permease protein LptF